MAEYSYIKYENGQFYCRVCDGKNFHYGDCPMPEILKYLEQGKKLVNGKIPAFTECPYKDKCGGNVCNHQGKGHQVPFSCAIARGYEIIEN